MTPLSFFQPRTPLTLENPARIVVIGGGPSGALFTIHLLRKARRQGKKISVTILEKKKELKFYDYSHLFSFREGCNYCAGGLSPKMIDALEAMDMTVPQEISQGEVTSFTVQGEWKNVEMRVPEGRRIILVYRGSKPKERSLKYINFDSFLLDNAVFEGAKVKTGQVLEINYTGEGRPRIEYAPPQGNSVFLEADFAVVATGVNHKPGMRLEEDRLYPSLKRALPKFVPPEVRRTLIFELEVKEAFSESVKGEVYFAESGSRDLKIDMFSLVPKGKFITVVLIGPAVDASRPQDNLDVARQFLDLPQIRKILPRSEILLPVCACNPNMTVGAARRPFGDRIALVGDLVVSRLYKDGIFSAHLTASALADCILDEGIDGASLERGYGPAIKGIHVDNRYGNRLFRVNRALFNWPFLSRMLYQAILTERKNLAKSRRRLADIIWKIVSGDGSYKSIWKAWFHPSVVRRLLVGGVLVTLRNCAAEHLFGLTWRGFGRFPTGVYKETVERKRREFYRRLDMPELAGPKEFEKMYTIRIKAGRDPILHQLGRFGDEDKAYFRPRIIGVKRLSGEANEIGSVIGYTTPLEAMNFRIVLTGIVEDRYLIYRVLDGFARGGVLLFEVEEKGPNIHLLTIYVAFDFPKGRGLAGRAYQRVFRALFPGFIHDVLWNHALCKLKDVVEDRGDAVESG